MDVTTWAQALHDASAWWWTLVPPLALQATLTLLAAAVLDALLPRRTWPELRAALWIVALARLVVPAEWFSVGKIGARALPGLTLPIDRTVFASTEAEGAAVFAAQAAFVVWGLGALALATLGIFHHGSVARALTTGLRFDWPPSLRSRFDAAALRAGLSRTPRVAHAQRVFTPSVVGVFRPIVLLPAETATRFTDAQLDHVLLHEFMHVKRKDALRDALLCALTVVYWFHPLVWLAGFRLASLREQCCDRAVVRRLGGQARAYRATLLELASHLADAPLPRALGFISPRPQVLARLRALELARPEQARTRVLTIGVVAALLFAAYLPVAPAASAAVDELGALLERPPGCLLLRYEIYRRLAAERAASPEIPASPGEGDKP